MERKIIDMGNMKKYQKEEERRGNEEKTSCVRQK